jgi:hypothetical protein
MNKKENGKNQIRQISYKRNARYLIIVLIFLLGSSIFWLWDPLGMNRSSGKPVAYIYQNGNLVEKIDLGANRQVTHLTISNENGQWNEVEVRPNSIGIIKANCPNQLCVAQGFLQHSLIPITCLPHRLVIQLRYEEESADSVMDMITY